MVGRRLRRCPACGVVLTLPSPTKQELDRAYGDWYRPASGRFAAGGDALLRWGRRLVARRIAALAPPGPVLDVGAGDGTMVAELRRRGREAVGIERADIDPVPDPPAGAEGWAAIVFWHSLEHLPEPGAALDRAAATLAPGGLLVVATPNHSSLQAAAFGDRWLHLDLPRHLSHPSSRVLVERIRRAGLRVDRVSRWGGGQVVFGWLYGLVGALPAGGDLYAAIRRPEARPGEVPTAGARRLATLLAGLLLLPAAAIMALIETALGRAGTIEVEARRG